ncbi:MAG: VCBS repeat-containing protein [Ectothiorhodospiraceae bacterium]|nr:VCBS repeat-containing protein [Ectothiorhodospiraceae bacterium]
MLADVTQDGQSDLVAAVEGGGLRWHLSAGIFLFDLAFLVHPISTDVMDTVALAVGDVDGDGRPDVVAGNRGQRNRLYVGDSGGGWSASTIGTDVGVETDDTRAVALLDVDGDGDLDLLVGNADAPDRLYRNDGTASPFAGATPEPLTGGVLATRAFALADLDDDGDEDLVVLADEGVRVFLGDGSAAPFAHTAGTEVGTALGDARAIAIGDMDGDGRVDLVVGRFGLPDLLFLNQGGNTVFAGTGAAIGTDALDTVSVAVGDVDGDGDFDVVAAIAGGPDRLYRNDGTPAPFASAVGEVLTVDGVDSRAVALDDLDRDGDLDVVVAGGSEMDRVYLNHGTDNPFTRAVVASIGTSARATIALATGDVDGDGDIDVVSGNHSAQRSRLFAGQPGTDPFAGVAGVDLAGDAWPVSALALGDLDQDGRPDLVVLRYGASPSLAWYPNDGAGAPFDSAPPLGIGADVLLSRSIALGDVDGDGDFDAVVAVEQGGRNRLYLNDGGATPFAGALGRDIGIDTDDTLAIALADVNRDGRLDVIAGNAGQRNRLYLNNGTGDPFAGVVGTDIGPEAELTRSIAVGDVNRDGRLDVVAGNADGGAVRWYAAGAGPDPFAGAVGVAITTEVADLVAVRLGDTDRDGDLDLVVARSDGPLVNLPGNGGPEPFAGAVAQTIVDDAGPVRAVELIDVDRDGHLDVVVGRDSASVSNEVYLNAGARRAFVGIATGTLGAAGVRGVAVADLDRDGAPDIVTVGQGGALLHRGDGRFAPIAGAATASAVGTGQDALLAVVAGDVDGDGRLDLVTIGEAVAPRFHRNAGGADPFAAAGTPIGSVPATSAVLGDIDGDGDLDLILGLDGAPSRLHRNDGSGDPFAGAGVDIGTAARHTRALVLADLDRDGDLDLVAASAGVGETNLYHRNDGGADPFAAPGTALSNDTVPTLALTAGDVDGDGDLDLVAGNDGAPIRLYLNGGGTAPFAGAQGVDVGSTADPTTGLALVDVDLDGDLDLLATNAGAPTRLYLNNSTAAPFAGVEAVDLPEAGAGARAVATGDLDRDGVADVVTAGADGVARLHLARPFDTARGAAQGRWNFGLPPNLHSVVLTAETSEPPNAALYWSLSTTSFPGSEWFLARPGVPFRPYDYRRALGWKVELASRSPARTPRVDTLVLDARFDSDLDGVLDATDAFPLDPAASVDTDGDGMPDDYNADASQAVRDASPLVIDEDDDDDGVADTADNCPLVVNTGQADVDGDGRGDVCDTLDDRETCFPAGDGVAGFALVCF